MDYDEPFDELDKRSQELQAEILADLKRAHESILRAEGILEEIPEGSVWNGAIDDIFADVSEASRAIDNLVYSVGRM